MKISGKKLLESFSGICDLVMCVNISKHFGSV